MTSSNKDYPSREYLNKIFIYDPNTGNLYWKKRASKFFKNKHQCAAWNAKNAKKIAGTKRSDGYIQITINGNRGYFAHRIIAVMQGMPIIGKQIDHINHCKHDNRFSNLRVVSRSENKKNCPKPVNNTSGCVGVVWIKDRMKWRSSIKVCGKTIFLGYFEDFNKAVSSRKSAENKYGFHKNHGKTARKGFINFSGVGSD